MRPTWNAISREGQKLYSLIFDTLGLYARSVDDLKLLLDAFQLVDDEPEEPFHLEGAKFAFMNMPTSEWPEAGPGTAAAMTKAAELLRAHGAQVEEITLPEDFHHIEFYYDQVLSGDGRAAFLSDYQTAKTQLDSFIVGHVENKDRHSRKDQLKAFDAIAAMRPKMDVIADGYAAIITPSVIDEAPVGHGHTGSTAFNVLWTAMHTPVVNVPGFKGPHGLPVGLSVVTSRYRDQYLLRVCREVGKVFEAEGGWKNTL